MDRNSRNLKDRVRPGEIDRRQFLKILGLGAGGTIAGVAGLRHFREQFLHFHQNRITGKQYSSLAGQGPVTVEGFEFQTVLDAVDDLGMDPNGDTPINSAVKDAASQNALIEMPPGDYFVQPTASIDAGAVGFRGMGSSRQDVKFHIPKGTSSDTFSFESGDHVLLKNVSFEQTMNFDREFAIGFRSTTDGKMIRTQLLGAEPHPPSIGDTGDIQADFVRTSNKPKTVVVDDFIKHGPADIRNYGPGRNIFLIGKNTRFEIRNSDVRNTTYGSGLYANNSRREVIVENNYWENCTRAIRVNDGGTVRNNAIVIDTDAEVLGDPRNQYNAPATACNRCGDGQQPFRGIWVFDPGSNNSGTAVLENNHIWHISGGVYELINMDSGVDEIDINGGRVHSNIGGGNGITSDTDVDIGNIHVTGNVSINGSGFIHDSCIGPNVELSISSSNITRSADCKSAKDSIEQGQPPEGQGTTGVSGNTNSTDTTNGGKVSTVEDFTLSLSGGGSNNPVTYLFEVGESVTKESTTAEDTVFGNTVTGTLRGETDSYRIKGGLTRFQADQGASIKVDGQEISRSEFLTQYLRCQTN